jgi:hypothetical protein
MRHVLRIAAPLALMAATLTVIYAEVTAVIP